MKRNKHSIPAFTIMEVTVSMMVAAIVIGITYTAYTIVHQSFLAFKSKNDGIMILARLDYLIRRDFDQAMSIEKDNTGITITKKAQTVHYEILPEYVIRSAGIIDTFKISSQNVQTFFKGSDQAQQQIDELSFIITDHDNTIPYHYYKQYSSEELFKP